MAVAWSTGGAPIAREVCCGRVPEVQGDLPMLYGGAGLLDKGTHHEWWGYAGCGFVARLSGN